MKTYSANPQTVKRNWYVIDAEDKILGRLASEAARRLRGKHKAAFTPHVTGDYVVIINADKARVTGSKFTDKKYYHHTGYPGGMKETNFAKLQADFPERVIEIAVKGMLPKNRLGRDMFRQLKVYAGAEHPHTAQQPESIDF